MRIRIEFLVSLILTFSNNFYFDFTQRLDIRREPRESNTNTQIQVCGMYSPSVYCSVYGIPCGLDAENRCFACQRGEIYNYSKEYCSKTYDY